MSYVKAFLVIVQDIFWLIVRRKKQQDDPVQQNRNRYDQIDKDIATGDSTVTTAHATDDLDELDRLSRLQNKDGLQSGKR